MKEQSSKYVPISKVHLIPYSEKLSREKTFANFAVLWLWQKRAIRESFSAKIIFFTNSRKFSPLKVYLYTVTRVYGIQFFYWSCCLFKCSVWNLRNLLQVSHLLISPVLICLKLPADLWMWLWTWQWVVETVLISTSSTLPPLLPKSHMVDFWTSLMPVSHNTNWLVSWQAMSTTSQYVVWQQTVVVWLGGRVSPWQSPPKVVLKYNLIWAEQLLSSKDYLYFCELS